MGCDIHLVLEQRTHDKWVAINTFTGHHRAAWTLKTPDDYDWSSPIARSRNYKRFAALAGVRGDGPAPRGLPPDASDTARLLSEQWGRDAHSHSWLLLAEAIEIWQATSGEPAREFPGSYFFEVEASNPEDYRLLFWFDN